MTLGVKELVIFVIGFGVCFAIPSMVDQMVRKHRVRLVGPELIPIAMPLLAVFSYYNGESEIGVFGVAATVGYLVGVWRLKQADT